jgi:2-polyprenyl-6-hydroxyphenyl methylase/3-demethylubiquinone-9 3-methyltransferase
VDSLAPIVPQKVACKCCGDESLLFGVVDFNKNCEIRRQDPLPMSGVPIFYHRCPRCGFIFTIAFDEFSNERFIEIIYNEQYALVDPEYIEARPQSCAQFLCQAFAHHKSMSILDYGCGAGRLASLLREQGFDHVENYDPFVKEFSTRPKGRFDCVVSFEVMEHSNRPAETFNDIGTFMDEDGVLFFTTLLQPREIAGIGVGWWYIAPRNGHVSIFSSDALAAVVKPLGWYISSMTSSMHVGYRRPEFAAHIVNLTQSVGALK